MSKKMTKFICFIITATVLCSCAPKGGTDTEKEDDPSKNGQKAETAAEVTDESGSTAEPSWRKTDIQKPEGAFFVNSMNYLADGTLRIDSAGQDDQNSSIWDSRDNGNTWETADADTSLISEYGYHYSAEGSLYIYDGMRLAVSAGDGTESRSISMNEEEMICDAAMSGNTLAVLVNNSSGQFHIDIYDLQTMSCRQLENEQISEYADSQALGCIALDSTGGILYLTVLGSGEGSGIVRYDLNQDQFSFLIDQDTWSRLINPGEANGLVNPNEEILLSFAVNDTEDKMALRMMNMSDSQSRLYLCEKGIWEEENTASEGKLRIYGLYGGSEIRQAASLFQEQHPELEVTFETGYTGEDGVTLPDAVRTLNTELMAGEGPDLLILDGLPADSYVQKGILEDVTEIVEPEKERLFYNIISSYNNAGNIYKVPTAFCVPVILGDEETVAAENMDELMGVFEKKAGAGIPFITPRDLAETACSLFITSDIMQDTVDEGKLAGFYEDLERIAGQVMPDEERQAMEYYNRMTYWAEHYPFAGCNPELELYFGEAQAGVDKISIYEDYMHILAVCKEKGLSYQYLNREKGNHFIAKSVLGINHTGKNPEAARQFLKYYLSGETLNGDHLGSFSVIRSVMEDTGSGRYISENGESLGGTSRKDTPEKVMNLYKITPAELRELQTFFEGCDQPAADDPMVLRTVMEQADACLFEGKDPKSAAKDVCSEINLYLNE